MDDGQNESGPVATGSHLFTGEHFLSYWNESVRAVGTQDGAMAGCAARTRYHRDLSHVCKYKQRCQREFKKAKKEIERKSGSIVHIFFEYFSLFSIKNLASFILWE